MIETILSLISLCLLRAKMQVWRPPELLVNQSQETFLRLGRVLSSIPSLEIRFEDHLATTLDFDTSPGLKEFIKKGNT